MIYSKLLFAAVVALTAGAPAKDDGWEAFKAKYKKTYKDADDEDSRHSLYTVSLARVEELNRLNGKAGKAFGVNWMSDRYEHEQYKKGLVKPKDFVPTAPVLHFDEQDRQQATSVDWRFTQAVTPIKNQGQCGSCWAFSATETIESALILGTGGNAGLSLSPQQIASCAPSTGQYGCQGCNGGFTEGAYEYVKSAPGLANSFFIPYEQSLTAQTPTAACPKAKVDAITGEDEVLQGGYAQLSGYSYAVPPCTSGGCTEQDLGALSAALQKSPVSVCVNAGNWNDYTGGVMSAKACGPMGADYQDHCVQAVGFNAKAPTPYWIVRNSWSSTWGEDGYIYLEMAKNTCGLADDATVPQVKIDLSGEEQTAADERRAIMTKQAMRAH